MPDVLNCNIEYDPIEDDPKYAAIFRAVNEQVRSRYGSDTEGSSVREMWEYKKRILRLEYGIAWRSPADLNPCVLFD
jgi:hypothetical protein